MTKAIAMGLALAFTCGHTLAQTSETEPNDGFGQANLVGANDTITGTIATNGDEDFFRFRVSGAGALSVRLLDASPGLAYRLQVSDADQQQLRSTSGGTGEAVSIAMKLCGSGDPSRGMDYYVTVERAFGTADDGHAYRLLLALDTADVYECNDAVATATPVRLDDTIRASIATGGDRDFYAYDVPRAGVFEARLSNVAPGITGRLEFFGPDQQPISAVSGGSAGEGVTYRHLVEEPGRYYLSVRATSTTPTSPQLYRLFARLDSTDRNEPNGRFGRATDIVTCDTVVGTLQTVNDLDVFRFSAAAGDSLRLSVTNVGQELMPFVTVYDGDQQDREMRGFGVAENIDYGFVAPSEGVNYLVLSSQGRRRSDVAYRLVLEDGCRTSGVIDGAAVTATRAFPNPATDYLVVEFGGGADGSALRDARVLNLLGQPLGQVRVTGGGIGVAQFGLPAVPPGAYVLYARLPSGATLVVPFQRGE